jgi:hypothetical protein
VVVVEVVVDLDQHAGSLCGLQRVVVHVVGIDEAF